VLRRAFQDNFFYILNVPYFVEKQASNKELKKPAKKQANDFELYKVPVMLLDQGIGESSTPMSNKKWIQAARSARQGKTNARRLK